MSKLLRKVMVTAGLAALGGYLAGILTAPKSGRETREDIKKAGARGISEAERRLKQVSAELNELLESAKKQGTLLNDKARKELDELTEKASKTRTKLREMLSAIHEGDADDKDLQDAVQEASNAIGHLRVFLKK